MLVAVVALVVMALMASLAQPEAEELVPLGLTEKLTPVAVVALARQAIIPD
jgi:hypothetical protein